MLEDHRWRWSAVKVLDWVMKKASNYRGGEISHIGSVAELVQLVSNLFSAIWSGVGVCGMGTPLALTD